MCLGIPGRVVAITVTEARLAWVELLGVAREVNIACVLREGELPQACVGAWVLVHKGLAISRIDAREAQLTLQLLQELGAAQNLIQARQSRSGDPGPGLPG